ncbi:MAG: hypothetical protein WAM42_04790 [Candidatus Nitrosopolaris sp.]
MLKIGLKEHSFESFILDVYNRLAFFTPDGKEVWVTVRGENYISVLDGATYQEKTRIILPTNPGMQIFSPDGKYA